MIPAAVFRGTRLDAVFLEAEAGVEAAGRLILAYDCELEQLHLAARMRDHGFDQLASEAGAARLGPDIHAPQRSLMTVLRAGLNAKPGDREELRTAECAEHGRVAEPLLEKRKRLRGFELKSAAERIGVPLQPFEANFAEERRIGRGKPAQFDPG